MAALTRRLVAGDESAYRTFFDAYFGRLSRYLLVVTAGNEDAAREALQETFRRVVRHIRVFESGAVFWSWLTVLARSSQSDERRKRSRYLAFLERFTRYASASRAGADDGFRQDDLAAVLERNLGELPAEERQLLEWKYFEHCPVEEIARRLQTTGKAVESRLGRLRRKLRHDILAELRSESHE